MTLVNLAPIVLFVYNRPWHTQQTVEALQKNELVSESELFIYSDEAKNKDVQKSVDEVRDYIAKIKGFKKVTIIKRSKNLGLDPSIIDGVTEIVNRYGKIIVLEDDIVTSTYFLKFMNESLEFYENKKEVWHVSGWNYPIDTEGLGDVFLYRLMNCWGWATWADRWRYYESNIQLSTKKFSNIQINKLNLSINMNNFWSQVSVNLKEKDSNWDIRWYVTIFNHQGLCLNPSQSFVENIGIDGSGVHCGDNNIFISQLSLKKHIKFTDVLKENDIALEKIQKFYLSQKKSFLERVLNKIKRFIK
jgi:hypothetical protein